MVRTFANLVCCLFFVPISVSAAPSEPDARHILQDALQQRQSWTRAQAKILISADGAQVSQWNVSIDGSKVKGTSLVQPSGSDAGVLSTLCSDCYAKNSIVRFVAQPENDPSPGALSIFDPSLLASSTAWIPDPRSIGLTSSSLFVEHGIHVDTYYSESLMKDMLVSDDSFDGRKCVRLSCHRPTTELDVWVDEERKTLMSVRLVVSLDKVRLIDQVVNSYQQVEGFWALQESKFTRQQDGHEEVVNTKVEFESIGKELPADTFSLSSIPGLKPKSHVFWVMPPERPSPFPDDALFWDGQSIIRGVTGADFPEYASKPGRRGVSWLFWLNGLAICGVGLFLLSRIGRKDKPVASP